MARTGASVGRLVVCPTPIGNLEDVTLRVLETLGNADVVACEDTRHTRVLLERHGISGTTVSLHEHNERARAGELLERIREGATVALVSDAGTPLISDPGFALVRACLAAGLDARGAAGPERDPDGARALGAAARALALRWLSAARAGRARELLAAATDTLVAFESPRRLAGTLELLAGLDPRGRWQCAAS